MDKDRFRNEFSQAFFRSLEEGKIEVSAVPAAQLQALARACGDAVFAALHSMEDEPTPAPVAPPAGEDEHVLWEAKSQLALGLRYQLTSQRLRVFRGVFSRAVHEVDLIHVREVTATQSLGDRLVNIGDVTLVTSGNDTPNLVLENVKDPMEVRELVRKAYMAEQKRRGLRFREET